GRRGGLGAACACRTVDDRVAMMKRWFGKSFADYSVHHERIRLLEDTKGKGKADRSVVFADGFNRPEDGIAAGLLARGDVVWYACIPSLWQLRDPKGEGKATERQELHTGYGVHFGFIGHGHHRPHSLHRAAHPRWKGTSGSEREGETKGALVRP